MRSHTFDLCMEGKSGKRKFNKVDLTCYPTKYNLSVLHASIFIALINSSPYQSIFCFYGFKVWKAVLLMLTVWKGHAGPRRLSFAKYPSSGHYQVTGNWLWLATL